MTSFVGGWKICAICTRVRSDRTREFCALMKKLHCNPVLGVRPRVQHNPAEPLCAWSMSIGALARPS